MIDSISSTPAESSKVNGQNGTNILNHIDPLVLAYFYLIDAVMVSSQTALMQAKSLNGNAQAQQKLNREAGELKWFYVPTLKEKHKKVDHHNITIKINGTAVAAAEAKNQRVSAERQILEDRINVLLQGAQVGEAHVNTTTDESVQTMQEASKLINIVQELTFKALLRKPPPN